MTDRKFRALHLIATSGYTGAERYLEGLLEVLKENDRYECSVACPPGSLPTRIAPISSEIFEVDLLSTGTSKASRSLKKLLREKGFDLLHAHGPRAHFIGYFASRKIKNLKLAATVYELLTHRKDMGLFRQNAFVLTERRILRGTPYLSPISDFVMKELQRLGIRQEAMKRVYFGLKLDEEGGEASKNRRKAKEGFIIKHGLPRNQRFIGTVGRLMPHKGHECLLKAIPALISTLSDVTTIILGDGPLYDDLIALAKELGILSNVHFIKQVENALDFIRALDLFVLPSHYESFGIAILEAMSLGKPVIATDVGGIPELIENNKTGFLIKPDDYGALAAKSLQILTDPILAQKIAEEALNSAKSKFSKANFKREAEDFYNMIFKENEE